MPDSYFSLTDEDQRIILDTGAAVFGRASYVLEVVAHKQVFFNASYANYDDCLEGKLRLLPDDDDLAGLARDYAKMNQAGMFYASPPSFDDLKQSIADLEELINS